MKKPKVGIIVLTHNGLKYCHRCLNSIAITQDVDYEVVVVDSASGWLTRLYLQWAFLQKKMKYLAYSEENLFYAKGNNLGGRLTSSDVTHVMILNPDIEIRDPLWLSRMLDVHKPGITAYGYIGTLPYADGFCMLIDKEVFIKYPFDETYFFWWSDLRLQSKLLNEGYSVQCIRDYKRQLYHFGGKSKIKSSDMKKSQNQVDLDTVKGWFQGREIETILRVD